MVLLEPTKSLDQALQVEESLLKVNSDGISATVIVNNSNSSCQLNECMELSYVSEAEVVDCTYCTQW